MWSGTDQVMSKLALKNGKWWGRINRQSTEDFQGSENILYDTVMMDHVITHMSKLVECT